MEHLAIMDKKTISKIMYGSKSIESRFSKNRITPYKKINIGDTIYLKESGKDICGKFIAKDVLYFNNLNETRMMEIKSKYGSMVNAPDDYWNIKMDSKYGTLIYIKSPEYITPIRVYKKGRQGFVSFNNVDDLKVTNKKNVLI